MRKYFLKFWVLENTNEEDVFNGQETICTFIMLKGYNKCVHIIKYKILKYLFSKTHRKL